MHHAIHRVATVRSSGSPRGVVVLGTLVAALGLASCGEQAPPAIAPAPANAPQVVAPAAASEAAPASPAAPVATAPTVAPSAPAPSADGTVTAGQVTVAIPKGWIVEGASSAMRLLEMRVPADTARGAASDDDCLVAFFSFGGDVASNLERWRGMVVDAAGKPSTAQPVTQVAQGLTVHTIEMTGTYMDGMPGGPRTPRADWTFRGAVIETEGRLTFIRMTGPKGAMEKASGGWETLIKSISPAAR